jgi:hypothetical protein
VSYPVRDPVGGVVDRAAPAGSTGEPPRASVAWGTPSRDRALADAEGREGSKDWAQVPVDQKPMARAESRAEAAGVLGPGLIPCRRVRTSVPNGYSPRALGQS